jgi:quinol monooxygenase YgiN
MIEPTRAEAGCESYVLHESTEGDGVFAFYETWTTQEHWNTNMTQPHLTGPLEALRSMLDGDIQVRHRDYRLNRRRLTLASRRTYLRQPTVFA